MKCFFRVFALGLICSFLLVCTSVATSPVESPYVSEPAEPADSLLGATETYLPPEQFFSLADEEGIEVYAVQTAPNTPVTSSTGLKGILLDLFGPYEPTITQLQYRQGSNQYYTYVNDISPDYIWLCSAGIFALVLFCVFRLGGVVLSKR